MQFSFGDYCLDPERRELSRGARTIATGPRVFDLLAYLLTSRERVVGKEELFHAVWGGRLVSDSTLASHIHAVRKAIGDSGDQQVLIRTVARRGYRFVGNVDERRFIPPPDQELNAENREAAEVQGLRNKASIAVLPFRNVTGNPKHEYFVDGMVEEITTAVARLPRLFVIARNSSFMYKDKAIDLKQVARELVVDYVLEGSVRRAGNRVRITAQLIDTTNGALLWAERFDGALSNIFELQDRIASSVAGAIAPKLMLAEITRTSRKPTASLDAYDLYLRAVAESRKPNLEGCEAALSMCRQALVIDPSYALAASFIGIVRAYQWVAGVVFTDAESAEALHLARGAIERGNDDPDVLSSSGHTLALLAGEHAAAVNALHKATTLNPNSAQAWGLSAAVNCYANRPEAAITAAQHAMRLSPLDPLGYQFKFFRGYGLMLAGHYQEAVEWIDRSLYDRSDFHPAIRAKIALGGYLDLTQDAREWLSRLLNGDPAMTIARFTLFGAKFLSPGTLTRWIDGFRRAGVPEN